MMKKYILALMIAFLLVVVGCGKTTDSTEKIESEKTTINNGKPKKEVINGEEIDGYETEDGGFAAPME